MVATRGAKYTSNLNQCIAEEEIIECDAKANLLQFNVIFATPNRIDECEFNQSTENEDTTPKKPNLRHFNVTHFGQGFTLGRWQCNKC